VLSQSSMTVQAAVTLPCHNGGTEGVTTETKRIMRQMHGRASFALLKHRILSGLPNALSPPKGARAVKLTDPGRGSVRSCTNGQRNAIAGLAILLRRRRAQGWSEVDDLVGG
jgi:hypothetical protein